MRRDLPCEVGMTYSAPRLVLCLAIVCSFTLYSVDDHHAVAQSVDSRELSGEVQVREVMPTGWRRTVNGWENSTNWRPRGQSNQLLHWIHVSHKHESPRVIAALAELQRLHPLLYAVCLLAFTSTVIWISSLRRQASANLRPTSPPAELQSESVQVL